MVVALLAVVYLTMQSPEQTTRLSEIVRTWFSVIGYKGDSKQFRSDIHILEYLMLGLFVHLFFFAMGWKLWIGFIMVCLFGVFDEVLKIFLPTREFELVDLIKDFIGGGIAFTTVLLIDIIL